MINNNFWDNFVKLCNENGKKPNPVAKELGISSGSVTGWKNGVLPRDTAVRKIADYFGVSVDYLLGKTDQKEKPLIDADEELTECVETLKSRPDLRVFISYAQDADPSAIELLSSVVQNMISKKELDPENAKIAAFSGYAKPPKDSEADRAAEIERLTKRIRELENGSDS